MVMLGDIVLLVVVIGMLWVTSFDPLILFVCYPAYRTWKKTGGLEAWKPKTICTFLANAKARGL